MNLPPILGNPGTLLRLARASGGVAPTRIPRLLFLLARMTGATIGLTVEQALGRFGGMLAPSRSAPGSRAQPLFILGHYRSGTTLIHKLLAADPRFASVRTFDLLLPTCPLLLRSVAQGLLQGLARLFRIRQPFFHDYQVRLDDPNETEPLLLALASDWSAYWGYLFPRDASTLLNRFVRWPSEEIREGWVLAYSAHLERVSVRSGGRPLVVKDPPNTARVAVLLDLFPDGRFIHVVRDPVEVFLSMRGLWQEVILPRYALQHIGDRERDEIILHHYQVIMEGWEAQKRLIAPWNLVEVRYEDLVLDPLAWIREIYRHLRLPGFDGAAESIEARWLEERRYRPVVREGVCELPDKAEAILRPWRRRLGYSR